MTYTVASRHSSEQSLRKRFPDARPLDLTSRGEDPWVRFSPFYPHEGIPVPLWPGRVSASVEGIWQGLKVFESQDVDLSKLEVRSMKGLKRTVRRFGRVLGHRVEEGGTPLLSYAEARRRIYLPAYLWVLENRLQPELEQLRQLGARQRLVLLDYELNTDPDDLSRPLSHAGLVARYLDEAYPR